MVGYGQVWARTGPVPNSFYPQFATGWKQWFVFPVLAPQSLSLVGHNIATPPLACGLAGLARARWAHGSPSLLRPAVSPEIPAAASSETARLAAVLGPPVSWEGGRQHWGLW
jgi:hypothetical protein